MRHLVIGAVVLTACTTTVQQASPAPGGGSMAAPAAVAAAFMQAVADSNLTQMGELWGTAKGSAATTGEPSDWLKRMAVTQAYLRGWTARVAGENPGAAKRDERQLMVELTKPGCTKSMPVTMVVTKQGAWLVRTLDLEAAGVPGAPCNRISGT